MTNKKKIPLNLFEVCVSDNCSDDDTQLIVKKFHKAFDIKYNKNHINLGIPKNFLFD